MRARFPCEGGTEWMWVEVLTWNGAVLDGRLESDPERAGASVRVKLEDVMDYEDKLEDGTFFGDETGRVLHPEAFESAGAGATAGTALPLPHQRSGPVADRQSGARSGTLEAASGPGRGVPPRSAQRRRRGRLENTTTPFDAPPP